MLNTVLVTILFTVNQAFSIECPQPAVPENGRATFTRPMTKGARVRYACDMGYIHLGADERVCTSDGTWTDIEPVCAVNVAIFRPTAQSSTAVDSNGTALASSYAVDGILEGRCSSTQAQPNPYWSVDLLQEVAVHAVEILLPESQDEYSIEIWSESNAGIRTQCTQYKGKLEANVLHTFLCEKELPKARIVQIISRQKKQLTLCEVLVLSTKSPSTWQCGLAPENMQTMGVHNGQCYSRSDNGKELDWIQAQSTCLRSGGSLPLHINLLTQRFLESYLTHRRNTQKAQEFWIGLANSGVTGPNSWRWVDGSALNQTGVLLWGDSSSAAAASDESKAGQLAVALSSKAGWRWTTMSSDVQNSWLCQTIARHCSSPAVPEGGHVIIGRQPFDIGTVAQYGCAPGRALSGPPQRTCDSSGIWMPTDLPKCKLIDCGYITSIASNARVTYPNATQTLLGSVALYTCSPGYVLTNNGTRVCQRDGRWSGDDRQTICIPIKCRTPTTPQNGKVDANGTAYGDVAHFTCDENYVLVGADTIVCSATGTWMPNEEIHCKKNANIVAKKESLEVIATDDATTSLQKQINWLIISIAAVVVLLLIILTLLVYRSRKRREQQQQRTPDAPIYAVSSIIGTKSTVASSYNHSQDSAYASNEYASMEQSRMDVTELVVPAHMVQTLPDGNVHLTLHRAPMQRMPLQRSNSLTRSTPSQQSPCPPPRVKRPTKYQTVMTNMRKRLSLHQDEVEKQGERKLTSNDIVMVGLQHDSRQLSLPAFAQQRGASPTPSDVLYKFSDNESESGEPAHGHHNESPSEAATRSYHTDDDDLYEDLVISSNQIQVIQRQHR